MNAEIVNHNGPNTVVVHHDSDTQFNQFSRQQFLIKDACLMVEKMLDALEQYNPVTVEESAAMRDLFVKINKYTPRRGVFTPSAIGQQGVIS